MCKITKTVYTCGHGMKHTWSHCRGQIKEGLDSDVPACKETYELHVRNSHRCGSCTRADVEVEIRLDMGVTCLTEAQQTEFDNQLVEVFRNIPTSNWRAPAPPVYGRKPSQSRSITRRKGSLLRQEVKAEDVGGPEAWESNIVPASEDFVSVYETVCSGWDVEWPSETKSLTEELAEDAAERGMDAEDVQDQDQDEQDGEVQDEAELDGSEQDDGKLGMCEEGDLLLLAQQTPLPLDDTRDNHYTESGSSPPTTVVDTLMLQDITSADNVNTTFEATLDTATANLSTQPPLVLESDAQPAKSITKCSNRLPSQSPRVMNPYGPTSQLGIGGGTKVRYWYRQHKQHKFDSPKGQPEIGCWELVTVSLI